MTLALTPLPFFRWVGIVEAQQILRRLCIADAHRTFEIDRHKL